MKLHSAINGFFILLSVVSATIASGSSSEKSVSSEDETEGWILPNSSNKSPAVARLDLEHELMKRLRKDGVTTDQASPVYSEMPNIETHLERTKVSKRSAGSFEITSTSGWVRADTRKRDARKLKENKDPKYKRKKSASMDDFPCRNQEEQKDELRRSRSADGGAENEELEEGFATEGEDDTDVPPSVRFNNDLNKKKKGSKKKKASKHKKKILKKTPSKIRLKTKNPFKKKGKTIVLS